MTEKVQSLDPARSALDLGQASLDPTAPTRVNSLDLLTYLNAAIDESGEQQKAISSDLLVDPSYLRRMRTGEKPWSLRHLEKLPRSIRTIFLTLWAEGEGMPLTVINTLRAMADALEEQGRLALLGEVPRAGPVKMSLETARAARERGSNLTTRKAVTK